MRRIHLITTALFLLGASSCQGVSNPATETTEGHGEGDAAVLTPSPEPPSIDLEYGDSVSETLTSQEGDLWTFFGDAGDVVTIALSSDGSELLMCWNGLPLSKGTKQFGLCAVAVVHIPESER